DAVIAGRPGIVKFAPKAMGEIFAAMKNRKYSPEFLEWAGRGGYSQMIFANEMDSELRDKVFKKLEDRKGKGVLDVPANIFKGFFEGIEAAHNFREAILRYSAYLYFKDSLHKSGGTVKDYVASNRYIVRGLESVEDKAYQLSKDLLGAYDEVSMMGQTLRQYIIPFYSFTETNFRRYARMLENAFAYEGNAGAKAYKVISRSFRAVLLMGLIAAWNALLMRKQDGKLPPSVRERPHITLGEIGDDVFAFTNIGSLSELLEWFGLEDLRWTADDLMAPIDKAWGMITPFVKMPVELASGLNFYPQLTKPRAIRDRAEHLFNSLGVDSIYRLAAGKPTKGLGDIAQGAVVYKYDYKQSAYWEVMDRKREYQGNTSNTIYGVDDKSNALYYMKLAVRYGDEKAALKYLNQYFENGGTGRGIAQSFAALNPMYGFTGKETMEKGQQFVASLDDNEKKKLEIAQRYYDSDLALPAGLAQKLRGGLSDAEARNLLAGYIRATAKKAG
ncbi:MAG: hypothetical protein FWH48_03025, partial [Oscillospiraceae bacterium]|nr:hypothetical protein [Oscillospiraceae bacterium]